MLCYKRLDGFTSWETTICVESVIFMRNQKITSIRSKDQRMNDEILCFQRVQFFSDFYTFQYLPVLSIVAWSNRKLKWYSWSMSKVESRNAFLKKKKRVAVALYYAHLMVTIISAWIEFNTAFLPSNWIWVLFFSGNGNGEYASNKIIASFRRQFILSLSGFFPIVVGQHEFKCVYSNRACAGESWKRKISNNGCYGCTKYMIQWLSSQRVKNSLVRSILGKIICLYGIRCLGDHINKSAYINKEESLISATISWHTLWAPFHFTKKNHALNIYIFLCNINDYLRSVPTMDWYLYSGFNM